MPAYLAPGVPDWTTVPGGSVVDRLLRSPVARWLVPQNPTEQAQSMVQPLEAPAVHGLAAVGANLLGEGAWRLLLERYAQGAGQKLGEGIDSLARLIHEPAYGQWVVKNAPDVSIYGQHGFFPEETMTPEWIERRADRMRTTVVPTQVVRHPETGEAFYIQPAVERPKDLAPGRYTEHQSKVSRRTDLSPAQQAAGTIKKEAAKRGVAAEDLKAMNVPIGKVGQRTRSYLVDVGGLGPSEHERKALELLGDARERLGRSSRVPPTPEWMDAVDQLRGMLERGAGVYPEGWQKASALANWLIKKIPPVTKDVKL